MNCTRCDKAVLMAWKFCAHCGQDLNVHLYGAGVLTLQGGSPLQGLGGMVGMINESNPGGKLDAHKAQVWTGAICTFPRGLEQLARKTIEGAHEPGHRLHGWKDVPDGFKRYSEALARHVLDEGKGHGVSFDQTVTVAWNAMARLEHRCMDDEKKGQACQQTRQA